MMILQMKHNTSRGLFLYEPLIYCVTFNSSSKLSLLQSLLVSNHPRDRFLPWGGLVRTMHLHRILEGYIRDNALPHWDRI